MGQDGIADDIPTQRRGGPTMGPRRPLRQNAKNNGHPGRPGWPWWKGPSCAPSGHSRCQITSPIARRNTRQVALRCCVKALSELFTVLLPAGKRFLAIGAWLPNRNPHGAPSARTILVPARRSRHWCISIQPVASLTSRCCCPVDPPCVEKSNCTGRASGSGHLQVK